MKRIRITEVNKSVRDFLNEILQGDGVVIEDEAGRTRGSFVPYGQRTDKAYEQLHAKLEASRKKHGVTEEDIRQEFLEDD